VSQWLCGIDTLPPTVTLDRTVTQTIQGGVLNASRPALALSG